MILTRDTDRSLSHVNLTPLWRVWCLALGGVIGAWICWDLLFPNSFWFMKLWCAGATGSTLGIAVGFAWHARDAVRRERSSYRLIALMLLVWGSFGIIAVTFIAPGLADAEAELSTIRSLSAANIEIIEIEFEDQPLVQTSVDDRLDAFAKLCKKSTLFYPSHESSIRRFELTIVLTDGSRMTYAARVPERHQRDITIEFQTRFAYTQILIPNGAGWVNHATEKQ